MVEGKAKAGSEVKTNCNGKAELAWIRMARSSGNPKAYPLGSCLSRFQLNSRPEGAAQYGPAALCPTKLPRDDYNAEEPNKTSGADKTPDTTIIGLGSFVGHRSRGAF